MKDRKIIVSTMILALAVSGIVGFGALNKALADDSKTMTQQLAEKLNVSEDQVDTAMDQIRDEHKAERQAEISANLDKAVTDGVITSEQKQQILDKQAEMQKQMDEQRTAMEKWRTDSGIDWDKLQDYGVGGPGMGRGMHGEGRGMHGGFGMGM